ncbi:unnamed protein product [Rhizoctonia solani]|uniref:Uncharacterized protein n=1 Tax=Rhizoctonia solani TaxID=456999 RepID=A0A8H3A5I6_9AGAM|nr:unnamed protein product [Rhizoctonia solani]
MGPTQHLNRLIFFYFFSDSTSTLSVAGNLKSSRICLLFPYPVGLCPRSRQPCSIPPPSRHLLTSLTLTMGCLPSRHQLNNFKEERRQAMVERRLSRRLSEKNGNGYLAPPQRNEEEHSGRSTPHAVWTEDDTYIPRFDSTLPRLR